MIRFAPGVGLALASPAVYGAFMGTRSVDEALLAFLLGVLGAAAGLWVLSNATRPQPQQNHAVATAEVEDEASSGD